MSLKRSGAGSTSKRTGGIKWDEHNLEENEKIKAALVTTKINEPKTPYHGPLGEEAMDEDHGGMQPLALEDHTHHLPSPTGAAGAAHGNSNGMSSAPEPISAPMEVDNATGYAEHAQAEQPAAQAQAQHVHIQETPVVVGGDEHDLRSGFSSDSEYHRSSANGTAHMDEETKKAFTQHRKQHYNMREALRRARALLSGEEGEGRDDHDDEYGSASSENLDDDVSGGAAAGTRTGVVANGPASAEAVGNGPSHHANGFA